MGILPPGVKPTWDSNGAQTQALILECYRRAEHERVHWESSLAGAKIQ